jgi:hypothetical protein
MLSGKPLVNRQEAYQTPDGQYRWVLTSKAPTRDASGNVSGLVSTMLDVTDLHPCPTGQYVSDTSPSPTGLASSLRSAVSSILTNAEVAARLAGNQAGLLGRLERIRTDALRAGARLEDLAERSGLTDGQADLVAEARAAVEEVDDALPNLLNVRLDAPREGVRVPLGAGFLRGVVRDLILWACGDCHADQSVTVRIRAEQPTDDTPVCALSVRPEGQARSTPDHPEEPNAPRRRSSATTRSTEMLETLRAMIVVRGAQLQWTSAPEAPETPEVRLVVPIDSDNAR